MEVTEILQEQGLSEPFCLDLAWDFVCHLRSRHGFTKAEKAELLESFHRFSQGTGELSTLKILELMGWLGLGGCIEKAHEMLRCSPATGRLVAALAECEIFTENQLLEVITLRHGIKTAVTFGSFDRGAAGADIAASQGPSGLRAARTARTKLPGIAWDTWVIVAEEARKVTPIWNRKRACFKEPEVAELKKAFGLPLQHADDRHRFQDALAEAHRTAVDSGSMDDVTDVRKDSIPSPRSSGTVIFATFLHLVRSYLESIKQKQMQREEAALRSVSFSATEVADFRAIFTSHVVSAREPCHPLSFVVRCLAMQPRVSCSEVIRMAASVGARIKMSHRSMLRKKIREFSDQKTLIDIEDEELPDDEFALEDGVDFAGFLRIMQWMSDCNWCNINTAAEELLLNPRSVATAGFSRCPAVPAELGSSGSAHCTAIWHSQLRILIQPLEIFWDESELGSGGKLHTKEKPKVDSDTEPKISGSVTKKVTPVLAPEMEMDLHDSLSSTGSTCHRVTEDVKRHAKKNRSRKNPASPRNLTTPCSVRSTPNGVLRIRANAPFKGSFDDGIRRW
eukprot:s138_g20.t1